MNRIMKLNSVILESTRKLVKNVKPGKRTKILMTPIIYVKNPQLLGVHLDCSLSFAEHTQIVAA